MTLRCPDAYGLLCPYEATSVGDLAAHLIIVHHWPASTALESARRRFAGTRA